MDRYLNSRTIPNQPWKSGFFQVHFYYQKMHRTIPGILRIPQPLGTVKLCVWNSMHSPVSFHLPTNGRPGYFGNSPTRPIKSNLKSSNPPVRLLLIAIVLVFLLLYFVTWNMLIVQKTLRFEERVRDRLFGTNRKFSEKLNIFCPRYSHGRVHIRR